MENKFTLKYLLLIASFLFYAGFAVAGDLKVRVWADSNDNGTQDGGEKGVKGVTVQLFKKNGQKIQQLNSDYNGNVHFKNVPENTDLRIRVMTPSNDFAYAKRDQGGNDKRDSDIETRQGYSSFFKVGNRTKEDVDAGLIVPGEVEVRVWADANDNGVQDGGEKGVKDVTVQLFKKNGQKIQQINSDYNGIVRFKKIPMKQDLRIRVLKSNDAAYAKRDQGGNDERDSDIETRQGYSSFFKVSKSGQQFKSVDAGLIVPGEIEVRVWSDANNNGVQNGGEKGVKDIAVQLFKKNGQKIQQINSDYNGIVRFKKVPMKQDLRIRVLKPKDAAYGKRDQGGDDNRDSDVDTKQGYSSFFKVSKSGQQLKSVDAGLLMPGRVEVRVWADANDNGVQDGGEKGVKGITVQLFKKNGQKIQQINSDYNGIVRFKQVPMQEDLRIRVLKSKDAAYAKRDQGGNDERDSDVDTKKGYSSFFKVSKSAYQFKNVDAGLIVPGEVEVRVWADANDNGRQDGGEKGVKGVVVQLFKKNGQKIQQINSDYNGIVRFKGVPMKQDLRIRALTPNNDHAYAKRDQGNDDNRDSDVETKQGYSSFFKVSKSGQRFRSIDAGMIVPGRVEVRVWNDKNKNGVQDGGEKGVKGIPVQLFKKNGQKIQQINSDYNGMVNFKNIPMKQDLRIRVLKPKEAAYTKRDQGGNEERDSDVDTRQGYSSFFRVEKSGKTFKMADAGLIMGDTKVNEEQEEEAPMPDCKVLAAQAYSSNGHAVWLNGFPFPASTGYNFGQKSVRFMYTKDAELTINKNGTAKLIGVIQGKDRPNVKFKVELYLKKERSYDEWSALGRGIKVPGSHQALADANKKNWLFWELDEAKTKLTGISGGVEGMEVELTHNPGDFSKGFQYGIAANDKTKDLGFSGWFKWKVEVQGKMLTGNGDFNHKVSCKKIVKEIERECVFTEHSENGHDFVIFGLPCIDNANYVFENGGKFTEYKDGTAKLVGRVYNTAEKSAKFDIELWLKERKDWAAWSAQGGTFKYNSRTKGQAIANYEFWNYFVLDSDKTTVVGVDGCVKGIDLKLTHTPEDYRYGFQMGYGANDKSIGYGMSGWFDWSAKIDGKDYDGNGDFNHQSDCPPFTTIERECVFFEHSENGHDFVAFDLPCVENVNFVFVDGGKFTQYADGTARLYGNLYNRGDESITLYAELWLKDRQNWDQWSANGGTYKYNSVNKGQAIATHELWDYYKLDEAKTKVIGTGGCLEGVQMKLLHNPSDFRYGFQMGDGANDKSMGYGMSGWFNWEATINGKKYDGNGDFNHVAECPPLVDIERECVFTEHSENGHDFVAFGLPCVENVNFVFVDGGTFTQYADGTARLYGNLYNRGDKNITLYADLWLKDGKDWAEWSAQGGSFKYNFRTEEQAKAEHMNWKYFVMDEEKTVVIGTGGCVDGWEISLTHEPEDYLYGFQMGLGANDKYPGYGFSGWFEWKAKADGKAYKGNGDFNHQVDCPPSSQSRRRKGATPEADNAGFITEEGPALELDAADITVYPNPTSSILNLEIPAVEAGAYTIRVADMMGRILINTKHDLLEGVNIINLDVNSLSAGAYTVQIEGNQQATGKWFVKQ